MPFKGMNLKLYLCRLRSAKNWLDFHLCGKNNVLYLWGRLGFDSESNWVVSTSSAGI